MKYNERKLNDETSEFFYYPMFEKWLKNCGYETFQSVKYKFGEIDLLGVQLFKTVEPKLASIEVKMKDWEAVYYQSIRRTQFAEKSYMGLVYKNTSDLTYLMYKFGQRFNRLNSQPFRLGVLMFDVERNCVLEILTAIRNKDISSIWKDVILREVGYDLSTRVK